MIVLDDDIDYDDDWWDTEPELIEIVEGVFVTDYLVGADCE